VKKTGRAVVAHEAPLTGGFASEIAAVIQVSYILKVFLSKSRYCHEAWTYLTGL
jgi:2-oxoisovalerate dehydrogenase E1 component beta subunit